MKRVVPGRWETEDGLWEWRAEREGRDVVLHVSGAHQAYAVESEGGGTFIVTNEAGESSRVVVTAHRAERWVTAFGRTWRLRAPDVGSRRVGAGSIGDGQIKSPMPGKVVAVEVAKGAEVEKGDLLVVVEAMKMEHPLRAPFDGTVTAVRAEVGRGVDGGDVLVVVEAGVEG